MGGSDWQTAFADRHQLPRSYLDYAQKWFAPLASRVALHHDGAGAGIVVGVNGSQGSGKTTVCDYLRERLIHWHGKRVISLSLDDFYLTREQRSRLAVEVHPLLATRGVPGTHDMGLLATTLEALLVNAVEPVVTVPRFDKALDDRKPQEAWEQVSAPVDVVLLEGWCLGVRAESEETLIQPVNELERLEDSESRWRSYVNEVTRREFEPLYDRIDRWVMLCAPSFDCVFRWRREQEHKLARGRGEAVSGHIMSDEQLTRFIQFYERITRRCLDDLPPRVHDLYRLDAERRVTGELHRERPSL
jgi:D-glycerate 3-kinase